MPRIGNNELQSLYNNRHEARTVGESSSRQPPRAGIVIRLFDSIPIELLEEIFLHCLSESPQPLAMELLYHSIDLQGNSPRVAPLLLCQICRHWRQAAISFPNIWTSLDVCVSVGKARPSASLATKWLARSGVLPLSLSLHQQSEWNDNRIATRQILELYQRYTSRWCNIHFDLMGPIHCRSLTSQQRSAPMLREFSIRTSFRIHQEGEMSLFGIFDSVPCLSKLHVSQNLDLDLLGYCSVPIPWLQLTSLSLDYIPSVCASLHVLEKCPNLTDASFKVEIYTIRSPLPINTVYHQLHSLTINICYDQISLFLGHVTFPGLIQVIIYVMGPLGLYGWPQTTLEEFLERSKCRLIHFEIHDTGMNDTELIACIRNRHLQSLVKFIVDDRRDWTWAFVTDQAIGLLTRSFLDSINVSNEDRIAEVESSRSAFFLPNLESLSILGSILWTADGIVAGMVESRWRFHCNGLKRLKRVELEIPPSHVEDVRKLKKLYREGLELDMILR